jgi:hypothetical protein
VRLHSVNWKQGRYEGYQDNSPLDNCPRTIAPQDNCPPRINAPEDNCPQTIAPRMIAPWTISTIAPWTISTIAPQLISPDNAPPVDCPPECQALGPLVYQAKLYSLIGVSGRGLGMMGGVPVVLMFFFRVWWYWQAAQFHQRFSAQCWCAVVQGHGRI